MAPLVAGYALSIAALIAARYVDIRFCAGQTVDGTPADLGHFKRYVMLMVPISLLLPAIAWGLNALLAGIG
jgi:hypothetical protein